MPKVSQEHKDEVRRRLIDAAGTCLVRNGFQDVTTREILAEAGLSTGTFYNYFPSKEHLYEALAERMLSEDVERLRGELQRADAPEDGLRHFVTHFLLAGPEPAMALATFRSRTSGDDALAAIAALNAWIIDAFAPVVADAGAQGALADDLDPRALVELLDIIWDGLGRRAAQGSFQTGYDAVVAVLVSLLERGALPAPDA